MGLRSIIYMIGALLTPCTEPKPYMFCLRLWNLRIPLHRPSLLSTLTHKSRFSFLFLFQEIPER